MRLRCGLLLMGLVMSVGHGMGQEIPFVWQSDTYGKPGYLQGGRVAEKITPGKGSCGLVYKGKAQARIILAAKPTRAAQVAATEFQHYVEKITGARLRIVSDKVRPHPGYKVLIGESALTRALGLSNDGFKDQEYLIGSYGSMLVLMGRDEQEFGLIDYEGTGLWPEFSCYYEWRRKPQWAKRIGSVYAVDEFLQRYCGVRWFMPGPMGEVVPKRDGLSAANTLVRLRPWSDYRWYGPQNFRDYFNFIGSGKPDVSFPQRYGSKGWRAINLWMMRMKVFGTEAYGCNHSLVGEWFKKRLEGQPKVWAQVRAQGYGDDSKQLCLTSPKLVEMLVQDGKDYVAEKSNHERSHGRYFPIMAHDYGGQWCRCANCRKLLPDKSSDRSFAFWRDKASNYAWRLVDTVARRFKTELPGVWTCCCAYAEYTLPPDFELSDNVACTFCRVLVEYFKHPEYKPFAQKWLREWTQRVQRVYVWEYFDHIQMNGMEAFFPGIFLAEIERDLRFLRSIGVKGVFNELNSMHSCIPNIAQDHLNLYVFLKLLSQDRKEDLKASDLLADYAKQFYGPAAAPMKAFFTLAEKRFTNPDNWKLAGDQVLADWDVVCPPKVLSQFGVLVTKAESLATADPYKTRVRLVREAIYGMMEKNCHKHLKFVTNRKKVEVARIGPDVKPFATGRHHLGEFLTITGDPASPKTEAWLDYDTAHVYVRFRCHEPAMGALVRKVKPSDNRAEVANIFGDDSVEIFIDVGRTRSNRYVQIVGNVNGALWEASWNRPQPPNKEFRVGTRIHVREAKDHWVIDFTIPLNKLAPGGIKPGDQWGLNLCRNHRAGRGHTVSYTCWSPTFAGFHQPRRFGIVTFR